jgi:hypothetical protein
MIRAALAIALIGLLMPVDAASGSQAPVAKPAAAPSPPAHIAAAESVNVVTLIKASDTHAAIRTGTGPIHTVKVNDLVGATKAVVKEIGAGRIVLEETFTEKDGKPNRALIVIKEGERGGMRYLQRADEPAITGTRSIVMPITPDPAKSTPKKPPLM